jgi:hypothetical protein
MKSPPKKVKPISLKVPVKEKDIFKYNRRYDILSSGSIYDNKENREIKPDLVGMVPIYLREKYVLVYLGELIARCFLGQQPVNTYLRHKDGRKQHCSLDNLEYKVHIKMPKEHAKPLALVTEDGTFLEYYKSKHELHKVKGVPKHRIDDLIGTKERGGIWRYV